MIQEEEQYFCYNVSIRRAAGLVGIITMLLSIGLIIRSVYGIREFDEGGEDLCKPIKRQLSSSCPQILKTAWIVAVMLVVDSSFVLTSSFLLFCGVLHEMTWLMVPYMMWIKMTLSIHCVFCIFLATTYRIDAIGSEIMTNIFLIVIHLIFVHIVRKYDDKLMKKIFSRSDGVYA